MRPDKAESNKQLDFSKVQENTVTCGPMLLIIPPGFCIKITAPIHHSNLSARSISFMKTGFVLCHSSQFPV